MPESLPMTISATNIREEIECAIELRKLCQERLSAYKVPLFYTFVSELPLTIRGKLRRY